MNINNENKLPVMEAFYTLQGEGFHVGKAAYFIRLGGCDVACHWCDVKESWPIDTHPMLSVSEIVAKTLEHQGRLAVITGGEPLMHDLTDLTASLQSEGVKTNIETSGVYKISGNWDWICFSPKKFKNPTEEIYQIAHELKVIVVNQSDFKFAEEHANKVNENCIRLLQPEWSKKEKMLPEIIEYVKNNPKWRISLQTHKYIDIP